ncbi:rhodanese-like domain-containing protein [bacterium]|nr:rhodanese-like domain-containing protein [bacterium]
MNKIIITVVSVFTLSIVMTGCANEETKTIQPTQSTETNTQEISAVLTHEKIQNNEQVKIIDVRAPEEYNEQHISNSTLVPLDSLSSEIANVENLNKSDEIIVYCRSGRRSMEAYKILNSLGYTNVKTMVGGINEWKTLGYDVCLGSSLSC